VRVFGSARLAGRRPDRLVVGMLAAIVVAVVAAGWSGWSWWQAEHDAGLARARSRDAVLQDTRKALVTLHTLDYRTAKEDIEAWSTVTASDFDSNLVVADDDQRDRAVESELVATAEVRDIAVTELYSKQHTARVMATMQTEVHRADEDAQQRHSLLRLELTRDGTSWKVSEVQAAT